VPQAEVRIYIQLIKEGNAFEMNTKSVHERLIARIEAEAVIVFDDAGKAKSWLTKKNLALDDTPLSVLDTESGADQVSKVLASIASGGVV
jgi:uncharacterized protein (DUF2384 family)